MAGNSARPGLVVQPRDLALLRAVHALRVVGRDEAARVGGFGSVTRVNARLLALSRGGYLHRVAVGTERGGHRFLYALTPRGSAAVGLPFMAVPLKTNAIVAGQPFLEHQLRLNAVYLQLAHPTPPGQARLLRWQTFARPVVPGLALIPDAYAELDLPGGPLCAFLEIDQGTESRRVWRGKAEAYVRLAASGEFARRFGRDRFRVAVVAPSDRRVASLRTAIAATTTKLFWLTTAEAASTAAFWGPRWVRPADPTPQPFI